MQMLPMMGGVLTMSIISGRLISKIGKYPMFPIVGTALVAAAMMLLAQLRIETPLARMYLCMGLVGCGLGMVMQVLIVSWKSYYDWLKSCSRTPDRARRAL